MTEFLTTKEVASLLRIKERKVYDLVSSGVLPCTRAIGKLLFPREQIEAWLASNSEMPSPSVETSKAVRPDVFLGSHDPLLEWAIRESRCGLAMLFDSSRDGLERFAENGGIATGLHLPGAKQGDWNTDDVRQRFAGSPVVLVEWAKRQRGLALRADLSPLPGTLVEARGLRFVPRQQKAGSQIFFERLLGEAGLAPDDLELCRETLSEQDVVQTVAAGKADAGFALASLAAGFRLPFLPLGEERFDLLVDRRAWFEQPFQKLLAFCRSAAFSEKAAELDGYDISGFGTIHFNGG